MTIDQQNFKVMSDSVSVIRSLLAGGFGDDRVSVEVGPLGSVTEAPFIKVTVIDADSGTLGGGVRFSLTAEYIIPVNAFDKRSLLSLITVIRDNFVSVGRKSWAYETSATAAPCAWR